MHKKIRLNAAATAGLLIILFFLIIAVFAPVIAPYDPKEMIASYLPPSKEHILGTNDVGQDIFSEMVYGTRVSLQKVETLLFRDKICLPREQHL